MKQAVVASANVLEIAGSLAGVPYVGAAAGLLRDIIVSCDEVRVHKKKAESIRNKSVELLLLLEEQSPKLEGTELWQAIDEASSSFQAIHTRMAKLTRVSSLTMFWKSTDIADSLEQCESQLDSAKSLLQLTIATTQRNVQAIVTSTHAELSEVRDLLAQLFARSTLEPDQYRALQSSPRDGTSSSLAERLMEAGQKELHAMKQPLIIASELTSSPGPSSPHLPSTSPSASPSGSSSSSQNSSTLSASGAQRQYVRCQEALLTFHLQTGTLPSIKVLDDEVVKSGELAVAGGTYSDIWKGTWLGSKTVALKALRNIKASDPKAKERFEREMVVWSSLRSEHILPFYGIVTNLGNLIHMVSPWQSNGNVLEFAKLHEDADRLSLVKGAARGLEYLHANKIVHGNVKCTNILVTDKGEACICDFGMSKLVSEVTEKSASATLTAAGTGSARWLAPELIEGTISSPTLASDVYGFGMATLELMTGKHPWAERRRDASVIHDVVFQRKMPQRPATVQDDGLWSLMVSCWQHGPSERPRMTQVRKALELL